MPRTSSSSRPSVKFFPVYTPPKALPTPAPTPYVPPQNSIVQVQGPGVWDSIKQGFGWGVGTSIARSFFTPTQSSTPTPPVAQPSKCQQFENSFNNCVKAAPHDIQTCQDQLDKLNKCLST